MSNITVIQEQIKKVESDFDKTNVAGLLYPTEARYALQIFQSNSFLMDCASKNVASLQAALRNVAMVGLTLSPVLGLAYLIPRKGAVCLDISYKGMITLLHRFGAIHNMVVELVYEGDDFEYVPSRLDDPIRHVANVFSKNRGECIGGYAITSLPNGAIIPTVMTKEEFENIKNRSESAKAGKASPWSTDENEMRKKTVVRRASKMIPKTFIKPQFEESFKTAMELDLESGKLTPVDPGKSKDDFLNDIPDAVVVTDTADARS